LIVDASVVVTAFNQPQFTTALRGSELAAPDLLIPETLNAFWKAARVGLPTPAHSDILDALDRIQIMPCRPLAARAAEMAQRFDHPVYDCFYLALAELQGDVLITADKRLAPKITDRSLRKRVRLISI
jgi:predicted nucleic acid-binding protein